MGIRMGALAANQPKCFTEVSSTETIISRQLRQIEEAGIKDVVITTGPFEDALISYCKSLELDLNFRFINNPQYKTTNYIYNVNNLE